MRLFLFRNGMLIPLPPACLRKKEKKKKISIVFATLHYLRDGHWLYQKDLEITPILTKSNSTIKAASHNRVASTRMSKVHGKLLSQVAFWPNCSYTLCILLLLLLHAHKSCMKLACSSYLLREKIDHVGLGHDTISHLKIRCIKAVGYLWSTNT